MRITRYLNLFLKQRLAEFETNALIRKSDDPIALALDPLSSVLNDGLFWSKDSNFNDWLDGIDFRTLPKSINRTGQDKKNDNPVNGLFISNVRESESYELKGLNYFIDAPIELHVIEVLWTIIAGPALEEKLSEDCYGNRLHEYASSALNEGQRSSHSNIFKRYINQYNNWRDQAVDSARELSKSDNDVAILSLDLKSYFYNVDLDFHKIKDAVTVFYIDDDETRQSAILLTEMLESVFVRYGEKLRPHLNITHPDCEGNLSLPVGLASSSVIANWYLADFDNKVKHDISPIYYGRYVDDILIVFKNPTITETNSIQNFVKKHLPKILKRSGRDYLLEANGNQLPVQQDKLILQHFDKNHSRAGLEVFKQELDERSSAFKFLPTEEINKELDKHAYDVLYEGSANKLRSVVGLAENGPELSKYLANHITAHRLCKTAKEDIVTPELTLFFKGENALSFSHLWEKVYQYGIITKKYNFTTQFFEDINNEIGKISVGYNNDEILETVKSDLKKYNELSLSLSAALLDITPPDVFVGVINLPPERSFNTPKQSLSELIRPDSDIYGYTWSFRQANLLRHHLVAWPLANYLKDDSFDLTDEIPFLRNPKLDLDNIKLSLSPRFIHFDEWQLSSLTGYLQEDENLEGWPELSKQQYKVHISDLDIPIDVKFSRNSDDPSLSISSYSIGNEFRKEKLKVAIANLKIPVGDIEAAIREDKKANISAERQAELYKILNSALTEKVDMLVMPETSIPVSWLPFVVTFARRHQIAIVFGLEHWVVGDIAYNLIVEAMPFKTSGKYNSCAVIARIKNHYAPAELELITSLRLTPGDATLSSYNYHKIKWRGTCFATYNCFELSNISHRVLFKSEIDMLIACVWNKDTNYYQSILESTVRDLHCYTIQTNTSQYGGSCVLRPTKTETRIQIYVKGGDNSCVLTTELDIEALRKFHYQSKPLPGDQFKHLPPGFNNEAVLKR